MRRKLLCFAVILGIAYTGAGNAMALAPTFERVSFKQPQNTRVWVNTSSGVYHCPGSRYYGKTKRGTYMTEAEAVKAGNRPAYGRACG